MARSLPILAALCLTQIGCADPPIPVHGEQVFPPRVSPARHAAPPSPRAIAAVVLRGATVLTTERIEPGAAPSRELCALAMLTAARDVETLRSLLMDAEPAGQLLALIGLASVDRAAYEAALPGFREREQPVDFQRGCEGFDRPLGELVREHEALLSGDGELGDPVERWWPTPDPGHVEAGRTPAEWVERSTLGAARGEAREALGRCGRHALPALLAALEHADVRRRRASAWSLCELGPRALEAVPSLARALEHDADAQVRVAAACALEAIGPWAVEAAPALLRAARRDDPVLLQPEAQLAALGVLRDVERHSPGTVPASELRAASLRVAERALGDPVAWVREAARQQLFHAEPGNDADRAAALALAHPPDGERSVLYEVGCWSQGLVPLVDQRARAALLDHDPDVQQEGVSLLERAGQLGPIESALSALREGGGLDPRAITLAALLDPDARPPELVAALRPEASSALREAALRAAAGLPWPGVASVLTDALLALDARLRRAARRALDGIDDVAPHPELVETLFGGDPLLRVASADAVLSLARRGRRHGVIEQRAREVLRGALEPEALPVVRARAIEALADGDDLHLGHVSDQALEPWARLDVAARVLRRRGEAPSAMSAAAEGLLVDLLDSDDPALRREAATELADAGAERRLTPLLDDTDPQVRFLAAMAHLDGGDVAAVVAVLAADLDHLDELQRGDAAYALEHAVEALDGAPAPPALAPLLARLLDRLGPETCNVAALTLAALGPEALAQALQVATSRPAIAHLAFYLGQVIARGPDPGPAVQALDRALAREGDPRLRFLLTRARETPREVE